MQSRQLCKKRNTDRFHRKKLKRTAAWDKQSKPLSFFLDPITPPPLAGASERLGASHIMAGISPAAPSRLFFKWEAVLIELQFIAHGDQLRLHARADRNALILARKPCEILLFSGCIDAVMARGGLGTA